jgi:O-antigen/teichoic acid export membrane protein
MCPEVDTGTSHRHILRSTSIIGGASVINILISLLRTKVAAVLLGPAGIGLIGLFQNLMATASSVTALGFGTVGTRQIAEAAGREDSDAVAAARRALFWGTLILALLGVVLVWLLRVPLATRLLGDVRLARDVGWLALGVGLTVAGGSQGALLNGLRRIGDIARVSIWSSVLSTVMGVGALMLWGTQALVIFVLAAPLASFVIGHVYVARLPKVLARPTPLPQLMSQWRTLARLGTAFMVSGVVVTAGQLAVRSMVQQQLGAEALGQFQAAWAISMTYIGFVLGAMGTDYYPRLTGAIHDHAAVNRMVNEQTEVALLLAGPVFLAMLALAPWVIELLYSSKFTEATHILRWQILGDVLKVASWPLGFIILAAGDGRTFMLTESLAIAIFAALVWFGIPFIGVKATGVAFFAMYMLHLPLMYWLARRRTGFFWVVQVKRHMALLVAAAVIICLVSAESELLAASSGLLLALTFGLFTLNRLSHMTSLGSALAGIAGVGRSIMKKNGFRND